MQKETIPHPRDSWHRLKIICFLLKKNPSIEKAYTKWKTPAAKRYKHILVLKIIIDHTYIQNKYFRFDRLFLSNKFERFARKVLHAVRDIVSPYTTSR